MNNINLLLEYFKNNSVLLFFFKTVDRLRVKRSLSVETEKKDPIK